ncbi:hypothetical protein OG416_36825 (plasmid) [Streptomyces longwoodensis]|uniref:ATP-dependent DNA ligase n=1 Tax=Streptomyces longwoodensis TaxID=68231 RepID=UPI002F91990C|nr:hypothetical protein OG416_36825 [Streptomyces longwoodensis]
MHSGGWALLRSRQATDITAAFPEIHATALAQLPAGTGLDGELVARERARLTFARLQQRLARRGSNTAEGASWWPAHYVAPDLVHADGTPSLARPVPGRSRLMHRSRLEEMLRTHGPGSTPA